jgi:hypothetical protein
MRPTPIPDAEVWEGAVRKVIAPPNGDLTDNTIAPVEALIDQSVIGPRFSMRCELEGDDLERLQAGAVVWVSMYGEHLHPFSVDVAKAETAGTPSLHVAVDPGPSFRAWVDNLPEGVDAAVFTRGCIEALEHMLAT